jgi:hypothetical protein
MEATTILTRGACPQPPKSGFSSDIAYRGIGMRVLAVLTGVTAMRLQSIVPLPFNGFLRHFG